MCLISSPSSPPLIFLSNNCHQSRWKGNPISLVMSSDHTQNCFPPEDTQHHQLYNTCTSIHTYSLKCIFCTETDFSLNYQGNCWSIQVLVTTNEFLQHTCLKTALASSDLSAPLSLDDLDSWMTLCTFYVTMTKLSSRCTTPHFLLRNIAHPCTLSQTQLMSASLRNPTSSTSTIAVIPKFLYSKPISMLA